jgi:HEAT repeat protein
MLPIIPFEVLIPLTIAATALCLGLIVWIVIRRAVLTLWHRDGDRLTEQVERLVRHAYSTPGASGAGVVQWLGRGHPTRIESLVRAIERVETGNGSLNEWVEERTQIPVRLSQIVVAGGNPSRAISWTKRWARVAAARAAARLRLISAMPALIRAMDDPDHDVGYAAADALSQLNVPEAADAILQRITTKPTLNNARLAALIEHMDCDMTKLFRTHLEREDSQALFWTATLIGQKEMFDLITVVKPLLESPDPNVRAAACECVGELKIKLTDRWLAPLLYDEKWFVQSHAAKALGELHADWAVPDLVELLTSNEWWIRQNAADALVEIGAPSMDAVERLLESDDRFARHTSVEILERLGWIASVLQRAINGEAKAPVLLRLFGENGGVGYLENAVFVAPEEGVPILLEILRQQGDDATYGRLRAAAEQMPEHLQEMARAIAAEVKGR